MNRLVAWVLAVGGFVGLIASSVLTIEKIALLKDPFYVPTCSINPVLSCGSIMKTAQAEVFGFPNPLLGIAGFAVVTTLGVLLVSGVSLPRWVWIGLQVGVTFGVLFVHWLIVQSLYEIGALCPYCMVVWAVMIPIFWYTTLRNIRPTFQYHSVVLILWYLVIVAGVLQAFWFYWSSLV
ncbi:vitamin K epoxide reductase family protein [Lentzea sp. BCCO 10_0856]|uniref:Vitamin K epoxide reductase family protein n=1 Tax=Lentzea miocenica TaxID=3095431 RepID=A0ABU4SWT4_9PSEU|nr:vitamin K epoxide reductase family protein [Lentzea sp. BCCO 10_0856]MDX8030380.1 vitamin K epoxide reductase family protein [Lentzea sp. BCCO 10_0856]